MAESLGNFCHVSKISEILTNIKSAAQLRIYKVGLLSVYLAARITFMHISKLSTFYTPCITQNEEI